MIKYLKQHFIKVISNERGFAITGAIIAAGAALAVGAVGAAAISSSAQSQAAENATNLAKDQQSQALAEQKRLEEKYGLTPGELAREQRLFGIPQGEEAIKFAEGSLGLEPKMQSDLEKRSGMTGEELLASVGPETKQLLDTIAARQGKTGEELFMSEGAIPQALQDQVLKDVQNPEGAYQDTLNQKLELARQMVNQEANRRGVFGGTPEGGIRFENLGRAGVDLAIKSAEGSMAARQQALANASTLATQFQNLSGGARSEAGTIGQAALGEKEKSRNDLINYLTLMEQSSASAKGRAANVATQASGQAQNTVNQGYQNLIGIEGYKENIQGPAEVGLTGLAGIGGDVLGGELAAQIKTSNTDTSQLNYEDFLKSNPSSDPLSNLSDLTGSGKNKRQYSLY